MAEIDENVGVVSLGEILETSKVLIVLSPRSPFLPLSLNPL
jgi:hypothetical protein